MSQKAPTHNLGKYWRKWVFTLCMGGLSLATSSSEHAHSTPSVTSQNDPPSPYLTSEFEIDGPGILEVFTLSGDITVEKVSDTNKITVELYVDRGYNFWSKNKNLDNYRITMKQNGNKVVSSVEQKTDERSLFSDQITFSYKIYVPEQISSQLKTSGGDISISGIRGSQILKTAGGNISINDVGGEIKAYTSGGNIEILFSKGTIFAHTAGGNIIVEKSSGEIRFKTTGGRILASKVGGSMVAEVVGGDIHADFETISQGINLKTTAGTIEVALPPNKGFNLDLKGTQVFIPSGIQFSGTVKPNSVIGTLIGGGAPVIINNNYGTVTLTVRNHQ